MIDRTIEDLSSEREPTEPPATFTGAKRVALDIAFGHNSVEGIFRELESFATIENEEVRNWARDTLAMLHMRSPTSLKVALQAIRRGSSLSLLEALNMELKIATAFCVSAFLLKSFRWCYLIQFHSVGLAPTSPRASQLFLLIKSKSVRNGSHQASKTLPLQLFPDFSTQNLLT